MNGNIETLPRPNRRKPLDWLARGIEAALKNDVASDRLMLTLERAEAIEIVRMIDAQNGGAK